MNSKDLHFNNSTKRGLAWLLVFAMIFSMFAYNFANMPVSYADEGDTEGDITVTFVDQDSETILASVSDIVIPEDAEYATISALSLPDDPTSEGAIFIGYKATDSDVLYHGKATASDAVGIEELHIVGDTTLTATYEAIPEEPESEPPLDDPAPKSLVGITFRYESVDAESGYEEYSQTVGEDGKISEPENPPIPAGYVAFRGWSSDEGNTFFDFNSEITSNITLTAVFSNKYLIKYKNAPDGVVIQTAELAPNAIVPAPDDAIVAAIPRPTGTKLAYWYVEGGSDTDMYAFGTGTATSDFVLVPYFSNEHLVLFHSEGTQVEPQLVTDGTTATPVAPPTRQGYTFLRWSTTQNGETAYDFDALVTDDINLYAVWQANPAGVNYTLVYWLEKPNVSGDPGMDADKYAFYKSVTKTGGIAGTQLAFTAGQLDKIDYATYSYTVSPVLQGNGASVVNVYFKRNVYTLKFDLSPKATDSHNRNFVASLTLNGNTYQKGYNVATNMYSFTAKYEQDISNLWPSGQNATITESGQTRPNALSNWSNATWQFIGWDDPRSTDIFVTHRLTLTNDLLPATGMTTTFTALWNGAASKYKVHYYFEGLPGETGGVYYNGKYYIESTEYSQDYYSNNSSLLPKDISGMNIVNSGSQSGATKNFYYNRARYSLSFNLQGAPSQSGFSPSPNIMYGQNLTSLKPIDPVWQDANGKTLYVFKGWYLNAECSEGKEFSFDSTMPNGNLTIFAKWESSENTIRFFDGIGGTHIEGKDKGAATGSTINDPQIYIPGTAYDGKGEFIGWVRLIQGQYPSMFGFGTTPISGDLDLYATWKTNGFKITYDKGAGTGTPPVDGATYALGTQVRLQNGDALTPPADSVFYGWATVGADGSLSRIFYPYNIVSVNGNTTYVAQYGLKNNSVKVIYNADISESTPAGPITNQVAKNSTINLAGSIFTHATSELIGWSANPNATVPEYSLNASYNISGSDLELYGVWKKRAIDISDFDLDNLDLSGFAKTYGDADVDAVSDDDSSILFSDVEPAVRTWIKTKLPTVLNYNEADWNVQIVRHGDANVKGDDDSYSVTITYLGTAFDVAAVSDDGSFVINPKPVTISIGNDNKVFDTEDPNFDAAAWRATRINTVGLIPADDITLDYKVGRESGETLGTYAIKLYDTTGLVAHSTDAALTFDVTYPNYDFTITEGLFTITISSALQISASNYIGVYDGGAHGIDVTNASGAALTYSMSSNGPWSTSIPTWTDVTEAQTVYVKADKEGYHSAYAQATVTITKAPVTITVGSASKQFDTEDDFSKVSVGGGNLLDGSTVAYGAVERIAGFTDNAVGVYNDKLTVPFTAENYPNYNITVDAGDFTIVSSSALAITANPYSGVYDAAEHSISVVNTQNATLKYRLNKDDEWSNTLPQFENVVGATTVYVQATKTGYDTKTASATVTITKAPVTIGVGNGSKVFDTDDNLIAVPVNDATLLDGTKVAHGLVRRVADFTTESVGQYGDVLTVTFAAVDYPNYNIAVDNGDFAITQNTTLAISASPYVGNYDGNAHGISVTNAQNATLTYRTNETGEWVTEVPTWTDVTTAQTVYVKASKTGYADAFAQATVT
ncbi:MAG: InlB B-repeat-containing protein, partial [Clostridiales Family XIII bacterium]|nr:InlB B-repeat-containing protein [Clostridiales Family XIII bacterium]